MSRRPDCEAAGGERNAASSAADRWILALLAIAMLVSVPWLVHGRYDPVPRAGDGAVYIAAARALAAGEGYSYLGEPFVIRPPGFSVLLLPVLALAGTDFETLQLVLGAWGTLGALLLFAFYRTEVGWVSATALTAVVWFNPAFRELSNQVMSDVPGLALLFACLLIERWCDARPSPWREIALAIAIGISGYVRVTLLLLAPAVALARVCTQRRGASSSGRFRATGGASVARWLPLLVLPLLIQLPWALRNQSVERETPVEHTLFHSYGVAMWHTDITDPTSPTISMGDFTDRVADRIPRMLEVLGGRLYSRVTGPPHPIPAFFAIACWLFLLVRKRRSVDFYAGGLIVMLTVHFAFAPRLALPIYVHLLASTTQVLYEALAVRLGERRARVAAALPLLCILAVDFSPRANWDAIAKRHDRTERIARFVDAAMASDARVGAGRGLSLFLGLSLERPIYVLRGGARRGGIERTLDYIERHRLDAVVLDPDEPNGRHLLPVLGRRYDCEPTGVDATCLLRIPRGP